MHRARGRGDDQHRPDARRPAASRAPPKVEAGQPVHALSPRPALRRPQRRGGRRVAAPRRLQGLASPRRRARPRVEPAGGRPQGRRPSTPTSTSTSPTSWPRAGSDRSAPTTASTPTGSTTCSRPSASSTRSRSRPPIHDGWSKPKFVESGKAAIRRDRPCRGARAEGRSCVRARRLQRDRVPRPELVGRRLGRPRVRDPDLRGLAPQRVRRLGRAARRPQHALRPSPVVIGPDGDRRGGPPRRAEPPPAAQLRGEHDQRRAPVRARQDDEHAPPGRRHLHQHGGQARRLAVGRRGDGPPRRPLCPRRVDRRERRPDHSGAPAPPLAR